jgi:hypothetical protein
MDSNNNNNNNKNYINQLKEYWCDACGFYHTDSEEDDLVCSYCNQHKSHFFLLQMTVYHNYGFSKKQVLQCRDCQKEEAIVKAKAGVTATAVGDSRDLPLTFVLSNVQSDCDIRESICQAIEELCSKSELNVVNYYDAVKAAYLKDPQTDDYYPMTLRNYLIERGWDGKPPYRLIMLRMLPSGSLNQATFMSPAT